MSRSSSRPINEAAVWRSRVFKFWLPGSPFLSDADVAVFADSDGQGNVRPTNECRFSEQMATIKVWWN